MAIYIFFFSFLIIGSIIVGQRKASGFIFLCISFMGLIIGLRDATIGADTLSYISDFNMFRGMSFAQMWRNAIDFKEPLYVIISWLFSQISHNYTIFLLGWAMFPTFAIYYVLKDELQSGYDYIFAIIVVFILGFFAFFVAGIRQTAALSVVFFTYKFIRDKRLIPFLLCMGIAFLLHRSSLVFLVAFPISFLKIRWQYYFYIAIIVIVIMLNSFGLILSLSQVLFGDVYSSYGDIYESTQNSSALYIQAILLLLCINKHKILTIKENNVLFIFAIIGIIFQSMAGELAEMSRVAFYYCIFQIILLPKVMREYNSVVKITFIIACLFYLFFLTSANMPEYYFADFM